MAKTKILQIGKFFPPYSGGMETVLKNVCDSIYKHCDLNVIVANTSFKTAQEFFPYSITRVASIANIYSLSLCPTFPFWINKIKSDIVHIHLPNPLAELSFLVSNHQGKLIAHFHSDIVRQKNIMILYEKILLKFLDKCDKIIVPTPYHISSSKYINRYRDKCIIIPYGININEYLLKNKKEFENAEQLKNKNKPILLFVGRLVYYKGIQYLIEAMKNIDAILYIVGTGPLEKDMKNLSKKNGLDKKVIFVGHASDREVVTYFNACDIFIFPSVEKSEMFGVVQLEAMACRKPVISTELLTGVSWVNQHSKTGIVVEPKNSAELSAAIIYLIDNPAIRTQMGAEGRKRVESLFTVEIMKEKILNLYNELLTK